MKSTNQQRQFEQKKFQIVGKKKKKVLLTWKEVQIIDCV